MPNGGDCNYKLLAMRNGCRRATIEVKHGGALSMDDVKQSNEQGAIVALRNATRGSKQSMYSFLVNQDSMVRLYDVSSVHTCRFSLFAPSS